MFLADGSRVGMRDHSLGWSKLFSRGLELVGIPGNHDNCMLKPHVYTAGRALNEMVRKLYR
jgi:hypothetical protein